MQQKPANVSMQYFSGKFIACTLHEKAYPLLVNGDYFRNRDINVEAAGLLKIGISNTFCPDIDFTELHDKFFENTCSVMIARGSLAEL